MRGLRFFWHQSRYFSNTVATDGPAAGVAGVSGAGAAADWVRAAMRAWKAFKAAASVAADFGPGWSLICSLPSWTYQAFRKKGLGLWATAETPGGRTSLPAFSATAAEAGCRPRRFPMFFRVGSPGIEPGT